MQHMNGKVLIADDEREIGLALAEVVRREGLTPVLAGDGPSALQLIRTESPDILLLDFRMPGMDGMEVLRRAKGLDEDLPVILITGFAEVRGAVEAIRAGAHDYLAKPFDHHEVARVLLRALTERDRKRCRRRPQAAQNASLRELLGPSPATASLVADVERVSKSNFGALILGETGSGKEVIAAAIHNSSARAHAPFVPVDCGAIPETLLESELFGHERGAFTGASRQKAGKFEMARSGTLFLDEISNMPLASQAKLLRVLQERVIYRVGATQPLSVDVRVLAASNHDLAQLAVSGAFRGDLYFRLNEFTIRVPPLRERCEDILYLATRFLETTCLELAKEVRGFSDSAREALLAYHWPGNVRELRSVVRRAVLLAEDCVTEQHLQFHNQTGRPSAALPSRDREGADDALSLRELVKRQTARVEREALLETLRRTRGNKAAAARRLRIDYKTLYSKLKEYGIQANGETDHGPER